MKPKVKYVTDKKDKIKEVITAILRRCERMCI